MNEKKFDYFIKGEKGKWEVIIGLEVHAQVLSKSKLFSSSPTKFGADPNTQVSLVDSAFPGMLPVINQFCIEQSVKTGLGLNAKINLYSVFDRKNYWDPYHEYFFLHLVLDVVFLYLLSWCRTAYQV